MPRQPELDIYVFELTFRVRIPELKNQYNINDKKTNKAN